MSGKTSLGTRIYSRTSERVFCCCGPFLVEFWNGGVSREQATAAAQWLNETVLDSDRDWAIMSIHGPGSRLPKREARALLFEGVRSIEDRLLALAISLEVAGPRGALMRLVPRATSSLLPMKFPVSTQRNLAASVRWCASRLPAQGEFEVQEVIETLEAIREGP